MNKAWVWTITAAMVVGSVAYATLAVTRAWVLISSADLIQMLFALAIVVVPVLGVGLIIRELWFGWRTRQMGQILSAEGGLPAYRGGLTASGRPIKADADAAFGEYAQEVERAPQDWRSWFRLAIAYDDARDRKRARSAMRQAAKLFVNDSRA